MRKISQMEPWFAEEEKTAVMQYLNSGGWLTEFKETRNFEKMVADYVGSKYGIAVNNGTISLTVAALGLGIGRGDEVIVPDFTMIASANSLLLAGAKPIFVDISREDLCLDLDLVEDAISSRTKAIMFVSMNGRYTDMTRLKSIAENHNLFLIEDAAQSLGCKCAGKHLGTFGQVGSFSFSTPKIITTGQGGMLVTDDEKLYRLMSMIKDFGRSDIGNLSRQVDFHEIIGFNFKFTDLQAVIGIEQMKKLSWRVERKKAIFKIYHDLLESIPQIDFIPTNLKDTSPWFIDIIVERGRDELASFLKNQGIGTRYFYPAIHTQPPYSYVKKNFPVSDWASRSGLWLPSSAFLTDDDVHYVCDHVRKYFAHSG
ncbi:MAG: DegT/DnrJ/EryC1/StrS family aminotransferase [Candidatus Bathyarchaeota archaeon]|nr:DegT/DnrJ/EryC1/StrS family aminotransferase [Candidatus Bathyarchaeota archaeon]